MDKENAVNSSQPQVIVLSPSKTENSNGTTSKQTKVSIVAPPPSPRISSQSNLYLSPMKAQKNLLATPSTTPKFSLTIGASPAKDLQQINQSINSSKKSKPKRLFSEDSDNNNVSGSPPDQINSTQNSVKRKLDDIVVDGDQSSQSPKRKA